LVREAKPPIGGRIAKRRKQSTPPTTPSGNPNATSSTTTLDSTVTPSTTMSNHPSYGVDVSPLQNVPVVLFEDDELLGTYAEHEEW
jgi:hypothetical protein